MQGVIGTADAAATAERRLRDDEQGLAVFHWLAVFDQNGLDHAGCFGFDLVQQFHCFDDAQRIADIDLLADFDKRFGSGRRRAVESADHRRFDAVAFDCGGSRLNRAFGLALRKRFCRSFNFELQASATEDAIVLWKSDIECQAAVVKRAGMKVE